MDLSGKAAIVTGSGQGLGLAYARELAARGASVVINDVRAETAEQAVADITRSGGRAVSVVAPVGSTETAKALVERAVEAFGRLDVIVTKAGILRDKVLWKMTDDDFDAVIAFLASDAAAAQWPVTPVTFADELETVGEEFPAELTGAK